MSDEEKDKPKDSEAVGSKTGKDPKTGRFVAGNKLAGSRSGALNFATKWKIFIDKVASEKGVSPEEIDEYLFRVGWKKASEGDYSFYRDIHDRVYGRPVQPIQGSIVGDVNITFDEAFKDNDDEAIPETTGDSKI